MADATVIGRGTFIRGRVTGSGDLEIAGRVEGDVACSGEVLVDTSGLCGANIHARRVVVRGAVKGDLVAEDALVVEAGAKVVGDLRAPRITIAQGGLVRGHVQTGAAGAARSRTAASAARPAERPRVAAPPAKSGAAAKAIPAAAKSAPAKSASKHTNGPSQKSLPRGSALAGTRVGPPPPVVPALKKGTKAAQKKR